jgi:uncharacterized membrane protein
MADYVAYDYDTQRWTEGAAAQLLLIDQLQQEKALLESRRGDLYARSLGQSKQEALQAVIDRLKQLK